MSIYNMGFPGGSEVKASACNEGDLGSIPRLGRSPGEGKGDPLQYSGQNSMDCIVHGITKGWTPLSDFHFSHLSWDSLVAQLAKNPPTIQETPVRFLGGEDPLEKG